MHWCGDEFRIMALLIGECNWSCFRAYWRRSTWQWRCAWDSMTDLQRRDVVYFGLWAITLVLMGVL